MTTQSSNSAKSQTINEVDFAVALHKSVQSQIVEYVLPPKINQEFKYQDKFSFFPRITPKEFPDWI